MKILAAAVLLTALSYGQAPAPAPNSAPEPVKITPGTPAVKSPAEAPPQAITPPPPVSPDTVVAEVNGKKYTASEIDKLIASLPAQYQKVVRAQPQMLGQIFLIQRLTQEAEKAGLDQKQPYKEQLEMSRMQLLSTAELTDVNNSLQISEQDQQKYYQDNPDKFKEVKVKAIYVAYNPTPGKVAPDGKKMLTEPEAKAKVEDLAKQIQGGADFGKLARENSDDQASAAKDGDFGVIKTDSAYPKPIATAAFALKQGEVSAPIKQPNGFYLIRSEEITQQPYNQAVSQINQAVRQAKFQEWLKGLQAQYNVKIENPAYFTPRAPAQLEQVH